MTGVKHAALGLAVLLGPAAAGSLNLDAMPVCVVEAFNNFENGPCHLGETSCYCTPDHKKVLGSDIVQACVNDAEAVGSASMYISNFCATAGGGGGSGGGSTTATSNPGGPMSPYTTSSSMRPPGNPGLLPSATPQTSGYPTTTTTSAVSTASSYSMSSVTTAQTSYPAGNATTTAAGTGGSGATPTGPSASASTTPTGAAARQTGVAGTAVALALVGAFAMGLW